MVSFKTLYMTCIVEFTHKKYNLILLMFIIIKLTKSNIDWNTKIIEIDMSTDIRKLKIKDDENYSVDNVSKSYMNIVKII